MSWGNDATLGNTFCELEKKYLTLFTMNVDSDMCYLMYECVQHVIKMIDGSIAM